MTPAGDRLKRVLLLSIDEESIDRLIGIRRRIAVTSSRRRWTKVADVECSPMANWPLFRHSVKYQLMRPMSVFYRRTRTHISFVLFPRSRIQYLQQFITI